ncbi:WxL domain-containing protein, partial [Enterococcus faecalis]|uniref:WxL domain-containing protein n=1 Tax=Enterococcus faecalis TaxID=1351 RepID=UPI0021C98499
MKQIKFRHLATLGLCCSLLANSFTGITAIAETVTIESSPTAETVASEATTETEKKTKVEQTEQIEQTEQTKEAKNQQEHKETDATSQDTSEEDNQKEVAQPTEATTSSIEESLPKIESRGIPLKTIVYPKVQYDFVDETGAPFTTPLSFSGNYQARTGGLDGEKVAFPAPYNKLSTQANGTGSYILSINNSAGFPLTPQIIEKYGISPSIKYHAVFELDKLSITTSLKFADSIEYDFTAGSYWYAYMYKGYNVNTGVFDNSIEEGKLAPLTETNKDTKFKKNTLGFFEIIQPNTFGISSGDNSSTDHKYITLRGFDGTNTIKSKMIYKVTRKQVTEKFVNTSGVAITPPPGFTQNKKTPMTNNNFTYTSAKALPDTYQANGKTYKFKGWYKGKTKPATLKTTKTPSYAVTYDGNDDLNVVYEEIEAFDFPALTYQFGFVDESGKRVDASTIELTYDKWRGEVFSNNPLDISSSANWKTVSLEKGQIAPTKNNLKEITYPAQSLEILSGRMSQYSAANLTFTLPKYYENISIANKSGTFDAAYPFPNIYSNNNPEPVGRGDVSWAQLKKSGSQSFIFSKASLAAPIDIQVPSYLREIVHNPAIVAARGTYYTLDKPIYYYLTNRKVTENFVDASGTKITPPTGFTQGNQIPMTSDTFKYTAAKALPTSYTADGKTYLFQGWYKGKNKPNTLTTSTTPTYDTTFDDNDDMTAVYKEASISANLTMRGAVDVIDNGGTMEYWEVLLKNTGEAPLTSIKIKPTTDWESGISTPTELFILGTGQNTKVRPITKEQWEAG